MPANPNRPQLCVPHATTIENPSNPTAIAVSSTPNPVAAASGRPSLVELEAPMATPAAHYCYYTESDMCLGRRTGRRNGAGAAPCSRRTAALLAVLAIVGLVGARHLVGSAGASAGGRKGGLSGQGSGSSRNRAPSEEGSSTAAPTTGGGSYGGSSTSTPPPSGSHLRTTAAPTPRFVLQTSGVCARPIASATACAAAARELGLRDQSVSEDGHTTGVDVDPKGCYYEGGSLKYNALQKNTGRCTQLNRCLCSRPAPTPAPAPTPSPTPVPTKCADSHGVCSCRGTVYFGRRYVSGAASAGAERTFSQALETGHLIKRNVVSGVMCTAAAFHGDPAAGYLKACWCAAAALADPTPAPLAASACPATCKVWHDGCNDCVCDGIGKLGGCTKRMCHTTTAPTCSECH
jgi:hypothetical protein